MFGSFPPRALVGLAITKVYSGRLEPTLLWNQRIAEDEELSGVGIAEQALLNTAEHFESASIPLRFKSTTFVPVLNRRQSQNCKDPNKFDSIIPTELFSLG
jgi:hypothetical protein